MGLYAGRGPGTVEYPTAWQIFAVEVQITALEEIDLSKIGELQAK